MLDRGKSKRSFTDPVIFGFESLSNVTDVDDRYISKAAISVVLFDFIFGFVSKNKRLTDPSSWIR
jgi:hypothetical protein